MISAEIIKHSITKSGNELLSVEVYSPYILDAEIRTHGMLAQNASSNRAIPFATMKVAEYFTPDDVRYNEKGMQGFTKLSDQHKFGFDTVCKYMRNGIIEGLTQLESEYNIHKQHLNRYLTPWSMQRRIMTGNRYWWDEFFKLRLDTDADPAIQQVAKAIHVAITESHPEELKSGKWHLPYITKDELNNPIEDLLKVSSSRCARTSYNLNTSGKLSDVVADKKLFNFLVGGEITHETPLQHQAKEITEDWECGVTHMMRDGTMCSGRLQGFVEFRHYFKQNNIK